MDFNHSDSILIKTENCEESTSAQYDCVENDSSNEENCDIHFIKVENCDEKFRIDHLFNEAGDAGEHEFKCSYKQICHEEVIRRANEEELDKADPLCITNEPDRNVHHASTTSSDGFVDDDEDDIKILKFWSEHECSQKCNKLFTLNSLRTLRRESQALDYTNGGVNRLDVIILSVIRVIWCKKDEEKSNRDNKCDFKLLGETVCRDFFLFAHAIRPHRWKTLLEIYKKRGSLEKRLNPRIAESRRTAKKKIAK